MGFKDLCKANSLSQNNILNQSMLEPRKLKDRRIEILNNN